MYFYRIKIKCSSKIQYEKMKNKMNERSADSSEKNQVKQGIFKCNNGKLKGKE